MNIQVIYKDIPGFKGMGRVVGVASYAFPGMGCMYIVEDLDGNIPTKEYPYKTFIVQESLLHFCT